MPHFIKLQNVFIEHDWNGDKLEIIIKPGRKVFVNVDQIRLLEAVHDNSENEPFRYTRVCLGGEDFAYVQETPDMIVTEINNAANGMWPVPVKKEN